MDCPYPTGHSEEKPAEPPRFPIPFAPESTPPMWSGCFLSASRTVDLDRSLSVFSGDDMLFARGARSQPSSPLPGPLDRVKTGGASHSAQRPPDPLGSRNQDRTGCTPRSMPDMAANTVGSDRLGARSSGSAEGDGIHPQVSCRSTTGTGRAQTVLGAQRTLAHNHTQIRWTLIRVVAATLGTISSGPWRGSPEKNSNSSAWSR